MRIEIQCFQLLICVSLWMVTIYQTLADMKSYNLFLEQDVALLSSKMLIAEVFRNKKLNIFHKCLCSALPTMKSNNEFLSSPKTFNLPLRWLFDRTRCWLLNFSMLGEECWSWCSALKTQLSSWLSGGTLLLTRDVDCWNFQCRETKGCRLWKHCIPASFKIVNLFLWSNKLDF